MVGLGLLGLVVLALTVLWTPFAIARPVFKVIGYLTVLLVVVMACFTLFIAVDTGDFGYIREIVAGEVKVPSANLRSQPKLGREYVLETVNRGYKFEAIQWHYGHAVKGFVQFKHTDGCIRYLHKSTIKPTYGKRMHNLVYGHFVLLGCTLAIWAFIALITLAIGRAE